MIIAEVYEQEIHQGVKDLFMKLVIGLIYHIHGEVPMNLTFLQIVTLMMGLQTPPIQLVLHGVITMKQHADQLQILKITWSIVHVGKCLLLVKKLE